MILMKLFPTASCIMKAFLLVICLLTQDAVAISQPPAIFVQPPFDVYYKAGETIQLPCVASGTPKPLYKWKRNGIDFNPSGNDDRMAQLPNVGTIVINRPEDKDEGIYQCFAQNEYGTSASIHINVREAKMKQFVVEQDKYYRPYLGTHLTLVCVAPESVPQPEVFWVKKEIWGGFTPINYDERVTLDHESRLRIVNVMPEDGLGGQPYACMAMNPYVRDSAQGARQFVHTLGTTAELKPVTYLWASPTDHYGLRGRQFKIKCIFAGNPTPDVHWTRTDGMPMPDRASVASFGQELIIDDLQFEDNGEYECWATNTITPQRVQRTVRIRVESVPFWEEEPKDLEVGVGATARFSCSARAVPAPDIYWYFNGVPLREVTDHRLSGDRFLRVTTEMLELRNLTKEDGMVIQCNATNKHGYIWGDVYLSVLEEAPTILEPPPEETLAAEAQSVTIPCLTTGKPDPQITWFKEDRQITGGRYHTLVNGNLYIEHVLLSDAGDYRCKATNAYGEDEAQGRLTVRRRTSIVSGPGDLQNVAGTSAKFTCAATTDPEEMYRLQTRWFKDGKEILTGEQEQRLTQNNQDNSLTITGTVLRDTGTFQCVADNGLDSTSKSCVLIVKAPPDSPENVVVERCTAVNATVRWTSGNFNNAPIQYFTVEYNTSFAKDIWTYAVRVDESTSVANVSLTPWTNYTFRVKAYNRIGESPPSLPTATSCFTLPGLPYENPTNLRTIGDELGVLRILWTPMTQIQHNGPGFQYILQFKPKGAADTAFIKIPIDNWSQRQYDYTTPSPEAYQPYTIKMTSRNSVGESRARPAVITGYSGEGMPQSSTRPTELTAVNATATAAMLSWTFDLAVIDLVPTPIQGQFMGFWVYMWQEGYQVETFRRVEVTAAEALAGALGNTITVPVSRLLSAKTMVAQVAVKNNFFAGQASDPVKFQTLPGLPGPVEFIRARHIADTDITIEWGESTEYSGDLLGYDIAYQSVSGLDLGSARERDPQVTDPFQTWAMVGGLNPGTRYRVFVWARTESGRGEANFVELTTARAASPKNPQFTVVDVGEDFINITWVVDPYADSGTVIFVEYRMKDSTEWLQSTAEVLGNWKTLYGLEAGSTYDVRIVAYNQQSRKASSYIVVRTLGVSHAVELAANVGWFLASFFSMLALGSTLGVLVVCYRKGKRLSGSDSTKGFQSSESGSSGEGYRNNSYEDDSDYEGGNAKRRPSQLSNGKSYRPGTDDPDGDLDNSFRDREPRPDSWKSDQQQYEDGEGAPPPSKGDYTDDYYGYDGDYKYDDDYYRDGDDRGYDDDYYYRNGDDRRYDDDYDGYYDGNGNYDDGYDRRDDNYDDDDWSRRDDDADKKKTPEEDEGEGGKFDADGAPLPRTYTHAQNGRPPNPPPLPPMSPPLPPASVEDASSTSPSSSMSDFHARPPPGFLRPPRRPSSQHSGSVVSVVSTDV